jgi:Zn-dependent protease
MRTFDLLGIFITLPGIILGLTIHEFSHAYIAHRCGDNTARDQGRVTLNPLKHIDPLGFILLIVAGFGWAKPVMFTETNLKNPKTDVIKIALAGPFSNAFLAMFLSVVFSILIKFGLWNGTSQFLNEVYLSAIQINWVLFVFNLIPIPPLDGSHLLTHPLRKYPALYLGLYRYGTMALFGILIAQTFLKVTILPIFPIIEFLFKGFLSLVAPQISF